MNAEYDWKCADAQEALKIAGWPEWTEPSGLELRLSLLEKYTVLEGRTRPEYGWGGLGTRSSGEAAALIEKHMREWLAEWGVYITLWEPGEYCVVRSSPLSSRGESLRVSGAWRGGDTFRTKDFSAALVAGVRAVGKGSA